MNITPNVSEAHQSLYIPLHKNYITVAKYFVVESKDQCVHCTPWTQNFNFKVQGTGKYEKYYLMSIN